MSSLITTHPAYIAEAFTELNSMSSPATELPSFRPFRKSRVFFKHLSKVIKSRTFLGSYKHVPASYDRIIDAERPAHGSLKALSGQRLTNGDEHSITTDALGASPKNAGIVDVVGPISEDETNKHIEVELEIPKGTLTDIETSQNTYNLPSFDRRVVKEPFTNNRDLMDDMFDAILITRPFSRVEEGFWDVEATQQTELIRVAAPPPRSLGCQKVDTSITARDETGDTCIEVFPARKRALQFFYLRFLSNAGIYDLPAFDFTVEDVDRLFTCGMIMPEHLDHVFVSSMLGHGVLRRVLRTHGFPQIDGTVVPSRGQWTIPVSSHRPTRSEVFEFIANCERKRFDRRYTRHGYRIAAFERPLMTEAYARHRLARDGFWGLKRMADLNDEEVEKLLTVRDMTYIPPEAYLAKRCADLEGEEIKWKEVEPDLFADDTEAVVEESEPDFVPHQSLVTASEPPNSALTSSVGALTTSTDRGDTRSKGKKRARSPSVASEQSSVESPRRTRARFSHEEAGTSVSNSSERLYQPTSVPEPATPPKTPTERKKRTREDEVVGQALPEASPAKKMKASRGPDPPSPSATAPSDSVSRDPDAPPDPSSSRHSAGAVGPETSKMQSRRLIDLESLPVGAVSQCKSSKDRPPPRPTTDPTVLFDPYFNKFLRIPDEDRLARPEDYIINVDPDREKGPKYALLYDRIIPSWAELCARWKLPYPAREFGHGTQPDAEHEFSTRTPTRIVPPHRRLRREATRILHEAFPHIYPRREGRALTRQPTRDLKDVYPYLYPPSAPSEVPFERGRATVAQANVD